jgi:hypothetical protein
MIQESDKFVLLLGAGFSAPWGLPVMKDFMSRARRLYFEHERDLESGGDTHSEHFAGCYREMFRFHSECQAASWMFNRDWDNIEELYTQADLLRLSTQSDSAKQRCEQIAWSIWDVYRMTPPSLPHPMNAIPPPMADVISYAKTERGLQPVVVTTNYDVQCEIGIDVGKSASLPITNRYYYHGFEAPWQQSDPRFLKQTDDDVVIPPGALPGREERAVPIVKLHGSVNWFDCGGESWVASKEIGDQGQSITGINEEEFSVGRFLDAVRSQVGRNQRTTVSPAIVPPMLGKSSVARVIAKQWNKAIEYLGQAREIMVIGYSFPDTDTFMLRLLTEGLKQNHDLDSFTIVDKRPRADGWDATIERFFTPIARSKKVKFRELSSEGLLFNFAESMAHDA